MSVTDGRCVVTPADLAAWLADSLRADLEGVKDKAPKIYRLSNVSLVERIGPDRLIYHMHHPGGEQPPEDVPGVLETNRGDFPGIVRREVSGLIQMEVTWPLSPESFLESAVFRIDCWSWVESLVERLEKADGISPLAVDLFDPLAMVTGDEEDRDHRQLVYVWTPPGSEQADTLARLVADALTAGERVLVGAHSNQVLDELTAALLDLDKAWGREAVRWGWTGFEPVISRLGRDKPAEEADTGMAPGLNKKLEALEAAIASCQKSIGHWVRIRHLKREFVVQETLFRQKHVEWRTKKATVDRVEREWLRCQAELKTARKAWFNRAARVQNAGQACQDVAVRLGEAEAEVGLCRQEKDLLEIRLAEMGAELAGLEDICRDLAPTADLGQELRSLENEKNNSWLTYKRRPGQGITTGSSRPGPSGADHLE